MIVESIVTTVDGLGRANFAPMGVEWGEAEIVLKPYRETATFRNLLETGQAVVNLVDEVSYFVQGALSSPSFPSRPASVVTGAVMEAACSWRELRLLESETAEARARFRCAVVHRGFQREFVGYNRARAAVIEATILATRTRILPIADILAEFGRLQVIVDKTAGPAEREAMESLTEFVHKEAARQRSATP
ncbi:MAG TPA: DUF447 domain-containing protein [Vicinamibacteria bacterium]|nr:DUF447 domain-containing protein [Vicinamibacteria bacterium]